MFRQEQKKKEVSSDPFSVIESAISDLPDSHIPPNKAQLLAVKFNRLSANAARLVMDLKDQLGDTKVKARILKKSAYAVSTAKTVEEKRLDRDCNVDYLDAVRDEERLESKIEYAQTLSQVCKDYHIYFRQIGGQ
jgi:hypothetical protein